MQPDDPNQPIYVKMELYFRYNTPAEPSWNQSQQLKDGNSPSYLIASAHYWIDADVVYLPSQGTVVLAAESEEEQVQWMEMLQESGKVWVYT